MKTISLNIVLSYPVKWTKFQVLRDIIQNFYDDIGANNFSKLFKTEYKPYEKILILSIASKGFSYEWLLHMGASTKQNAPGKYAGFFGEGFKVASLCALRDYNWRINLRSRNWHIEVCTLCTSVEGKPLEQLAYNVWEDCNYSTETVLTIQSFSKEDADLFGEVLLGFYYPENSLFGSCIFENKFVAIYERSNQPKPSCLPKSINIHGDGIVYIGFQARGSFKLPLIICNHRFETKSRDRHSIYSGTILDILIDMVDYLDAKASCFLLEKFEKYWYNYPDKKRDVESWYPVIRKLICKIVFFDSQQNSYFVKKYPNLVVCEKPTNLYMHNRKTQALVWKKNNLPNARLVQDSFSLMGYEDVIDLCEESGGFNVLRKPYIYEQSLIKILEEAATVIFTDFFSSYPDCLIIENDTSAYNGTASLKKNPEKSYNSHGYRFKFTLVNIAIKKSSLVKNGFTAAFSTYCHELCHCFGGDATIVFSNALTAVLTIILEKSERVEFFSRLWNECFDSSHQLYDSSNLKIYSRKL
ncbi:MAG: hypothetical protein FWG77_09570 [Treponema sp.]|nr:hypothetical protein [Treponema sp.]